MTAILLALTLVISYSVPSNAESTSTTKSDDKLNIKHTGENSWEYIQERDDGVYKVIEKVNPNTGEVTSYIKKQNDSGEFILEKKHFTKPLDNGVEVVTEENGKKTTEVIKPETVETTPNFSALDEIEPFGDPTDPLTPWSYSYTTTNSVNYTAITVGIVSAALASRFGMSRKAAFIYSAAVTITASMIPTVYAKKVRYYKNVKGTTILAGIKDYNYVYKYSSFTGLIESGIEIDCASGYSCR